MSTANLLSGAPVLLRPALSLIGWTFVMEGWMYATRLPAISKYKVQADPTFTRERLNSQIPHNVRWKADNYDHLHEAPTRFYTICVALALAHSSSTSTLDLETNLAWAYVGLRIAHSIVQATTNVIMVRFSLFILSETVMLGLLYKAVQAIF